MLHDTVKLLLTFLGSSAPALAALPDDQVPLWLKITCVAVGPACVATLAQLDKLGHRHPSVSRTAPDLSPFTANDVPPTKTPPAPRRRKRTPTPSDAVLTEPVVATPAPRRPRPRPVVEETD